MDSKTIKQVRISLAEAIAVVGDEFDISVKVGNISYNSEGFTAKVIGEETDNNGVSQKVIKDWQMAVKLKLVENRWFNRMFSKSGETGRRVSVIGYDFNKRKYPLILQTIGGSAKYKMAVSDFKLFYKEV